MLHHHQSSSSQVYYKNNIIRDEGVVPPHLLGKPPPPNFDDFFEFFKQGLTPCLETIWRFSPKNILKNLPDFIFYRKWPYPPIFGNYLANLFWTIHQKYSADNFLDRKWSAPLFLNCQKSARFFWSIMPPLPLFGKKPKFGGGDPI